VKAPSVTDSTAFIDKYAAATGMSKADAKTLNDEYINDVKTTLKKGGTATISGLGSFKVGKRPAYSYVNSKGVTVTKPAYKDPSFHMYKSAGHQKFNEDPALRGAVN
jgi:nucleoid DNA-binding protein